MIPSAIPAAAIDPVSAAPKNGASEANPENGDKFAKVLNSVSSKDAPKDQAKNTESKPADDTDAEVTTKAPEKGSKETAESVTTTDGAATLEAAVVTAQITARPVETLPASTPTVPATPVTPTAETPAVAPAAPSEAPAIPVVAAAAQTATAMPATPVAAPAAGETVVTAPATAVTAQATATPTAQTPATPATQSTAPPALTASDPSAAPTPEAGAPTTPGTTVAAPTQDPNASVPVATTSTPAEVAGLSEEKLLESLTKTAATATTTGEQVNATADNKQAPTLVEAMTSTNAPRAADTTTLTAAKTAATQQAPLPEPVRQVVSLVAPLRHHGDGDYKLTLQLHPEHLGRVEVAVALNAGQISMQLSSDNAASRQMLKENMDQLRQALQDSGLDAGSLDVGSQNSQGQENTAQRGGNGHISNGLADGDEDEFFARLHNTESMKNVATDGPLDVRL